MRKGHRGSAPAATRRLRGQHMAVMQRYAAQEAFLAALGGRERSWSVRSVRSACRLSGISKSSVYRWLGADNAFAQQLRAGRAPPLPAPAAAAPALTRAHELLLSLGPEPDSAAMALLADEINAGIGIMQVEVPLLAVEVEAPPHPLIAELEQEKRLTAAGEQLLAYLRSLA